MRGLRGAAIEAEHRIETSYDNIDFTWPAGRGLEFKLESTYGKIRSRLPGTLREIGPYKFTPGEITKKLLTAYDEMVQRPHEGAAYVSTSAAE